MEKYFCWLERKPLSKYWTWCCFGGLSIQKWDLVGVWNNANLDLVWSFCVSTKFEILEILVQELLILKEGLQIKFLKKSPVELNAKCKILKNYIKETVNVASIKFYKVSIGIVLNIWGKFVQNIRHDVSQFKDWNLSSCQQWTSKSCWIILLNNNSWIILLQDIQKY